MNRKHFVLLFMSLVLAFALFISGSTPTQAAATDLLITGVVDGPLTGGIPKAVEFYVVNNIADLSIYGFGSANNGGGTDGEEFTFPADAATAGDFIYVATEAVAFADFFGFAPTYTDGTAPNINGDDAIELFENGTVIDVFGDINVDGSGQAWDYLDGWVYRVSGTEADGSVFNLTNWTYSGINALDGETTNATAAVPFPIGTYTPAAGGDTTAPLISSFDPTDDAIDVAVNTNLVAGFNESVQLNSGNITLHLSSDNSVVEAFDAATSGQLSVSGSNVTIDPTSDLDAATGYYVTIDNGAVEDLAGNPYQGFSGVTVWNFTTAAVAPTAPELVINEIDYDQVSTDASEFVEIMNIGADAVSLDGVTLLLVNGSNDTIYSTTNLPNVQLAAGDYFVVCANVATVANCDLDISPDTNLIQNGAPDAAALTFGATVLDAVSYEGDVAAPYVEGSGAGLADDPAVDNAGISRYPDGTDTNQNNVDLSQHCITPGAANTDASTDCPAPQIGNLVINEIDYDQDGTDAAEFVEIYNASNAILNLSTYELVLVNGSGTAVYSTTALPDLDLNPGQFFVVCGDAANVPNCDLDITPDTNLVQNGAPDAAALLENGVIIDTVSYEGDVAAPYTEGSGVGLVDNPADGYSGISRYPDGTDTDQNNVDLSQRCATPGEANTDANTECVPPVIEACGNAFTPIYDIQGNGLASTLDGSVVSTEGIVTATFFDTNQMGGFYIQDAAGDGDAATSDGIYVFTTFHMPTVGDKVRVKGTVDEYFDLTEITSVSSYISCGVDTPITATEVLLPVASIDDFEAYEGMLVTFPQQLTVTNNYTLGRYGELELSVNGRLYQPTNVVLPGTAANDLQDLNNRSRIQLDDGSNVQNPVPLPPYFNAEGTLRLGDTTDNLTAVMSYGFGAYELQPAGPVVFNGDNPRTDAPDVGGSVQVASFNVLNYFTTIDDSGPICGPLADQDCRGADTADEFTRQHDKIVDAIVSMDADVVGLIEIENHATDDALQFLVDGLNAVAGAGTYDYIPTGPIGDDAIKVAFIYQPASVFPVGNYAILDSSFDPLFLDDYNRPALAQTFAEHGTGGTFTAVINHLKSKGSDCLDVNDPDTGDGQGNCNITRTNAAIVLANWLATDPTGSGDADFLILGDLNSYAMEDPIMALTDAGYTNLMDAYNGLYSYQFQGQSGYLDHALANANLTAQVTGVAPWHINSDEPVALDYNNYNQPELYNADPYGSSDHDPVMVGLDLDRATNADGCYVLALGDSPFTGPATALAIGDPGYTPGVFQARRWGSSEGLSRMACYEIHGTDERDVIVGGNSSDQLFGYGGDDVLVGLKGQDVFTGGTGADVMQGNQGIDEVLDYEFGIDICNSIEIGC